MAQFVYEGPTQKETEINRAGGTAPSHPLRPINSRCLFRNVFCSSGTPLFQISSSASQRQPSPPSDLPTCPFNASFPYEFTQVKGTKIQRKQLSGGAEKKTSQKQSIVVFKVWGFNTALFPSFFQLFAFKDRSFCSKEREGVSLLSLHLPISPMVEDSEAIADTQSAEDWLHRAQELIACVLEKSKAVKGFAGRWKIIISKLEKFPSRLSDLSSHPCFSKNALCKEQLQAVVNTLEEANELGDRCREERYGGKLQMQSDLDALSAKLDLNFKDCGVLIKTGVLGEATFPLAIAQQSRESEGVDGGRNVRELLARLQIGHQEAKNRALNSLMEVMKEDEKALLAVLGRSNISALVQLLSASSSRIRDKTASMICSLVQLGSCEDLLVSEGVLPPLIRLAESGSMAGREKAMISLQRMSMTSETARSIVGHGGVCPLIEICQTGDPVPQSACIGTLRNLSAVPEMREALAEQGIIRVAIDLLGCGTSSLGTKEYAAECLQNLTSVHDNLRKAVVSEGGIRSLLAYIDGPLPQEPAVGALRNLVVSVPIHFLVSLGLLPRLIHVLKCGSLGAKQAAVSAVCRISTSAEMKRLIGEDGFIPLLVKMLEAKSNSLREVAAQAICGLLALPLNRREVKKNEMSVPNLVQLLDPNPQNTAKKYAVACLVYLSSSKHCKKTMISHGAIGYLKKLCEIDIPDADKLLERLDRGKLQSLFSRK
ncbi:hypothetical protein ACLOJK_006151 [Asimina triloba]